MSPIRVLLVEHPQVVLQTCETLTLAVAHVLVHIVERLSRTGQLGLDPIGETGAVIYTGEQFFGVILHGLERLHAHVGLTVTLGLLTHDDIAVEAPKGWGLGAVASTTTTTVAVAAAGNLPILGFDGQTHLTLHTRRG